MLTPLVLLYVTLRARLDEVRNDDRGMTTEAMIITAILAGVALAVVGLIAAAITRKGNEIESDIDAALVLL
jgi:prolipoprotein diacylglyceryltransferase